jgi:hypothetical protein
MSLVESIVRQIIGDILEGKVYETTLSNYTAHSRSKIFIQQLPDNQGFIVKEVEQNAFDLDEWNKTLELKSVADLENYLNGIINI